SRPLPDGGVAGGAQALADLVYGVHGLGLSVGAPTLPLARPCRNKKPENPLCRRLRARGRGRAVCTSPARSAPASGSPPLHPWTGGEFWLRFRASDLAHPPPQTLTAPNALRDFLEMPQ